MPSFDIMSEVDQPSLRNAVEQQLVDAVQGLHATIEMMPVDVEPVQPLPGVDAVMPRTAVPE